MTLEVCLDSVESARAAQAGGADRVELCANLLEGGTTPSAGLIRRTRKAIGIGLHVMIRPRGGDFLASSDELDVMLDDVDVARTAGAEGVVFGCLHADGTVDLAACRSLVAAARPMRVTFHRAFDVTRDPFEALEAIISLGCERVLTSGQAPTALEGAPLIAQLIDRAAGRIGIMPGGGITERTLRRVAAETGANEIHLALPRTEPSAMAFRNPDIYMGGCLFPPEFDRVVTDGAAVGRVRTVLSQSGPRG